MTKVSDELIEEMTQEVSRLKAGKINISARGISGLKLIVDELAALRAESYSAEPVAWRFRYLEEDAWSLSRNKSVLNLEDEMEIQPLYLASPPAKEVEITDVRIEQIARSYHDRTGDNETVDWDKCKSRYRTQVRKMVRNVLGCAALTNRTPDDEVGNG